MYFILLTFQNLFFRGSGAVLGMLKTGPKKLFLLDKKGQQNELDPICVLDFYIHESCQRMGLGKMLFAHFLEVVNESQVYVSFLAIISICYRTKNFTLKKLQSTVRRKNF